MTKPRNNNSKRKLFNIARNNIAKDRVNEFRYVNKIFKQGNLKK